MTNFRIPILILLFAFLCSTSKATTLPQIELQELFENSQIVTFAQITSAKLIPGSSDTKDFCGAAYVGNVKRSFKGGYTEGSNIDFGPYIGLEVGREYLLFLNTDKNYEPISSISNLQMKHRAERDQWYQQNCDSMPTTKISFDGMGALPVIWTFRWKNIGLKDGVLAPNRYIKYPIQVPKGPFGEDDETYPRERSDLTVGSKEILEKVLNNLSKIQNEKQ